MRLGTSLAINQPRRVGRFNPNSIAGLQAWALSTAPYYHGSTVDGLQVLDSKETIGTHRAPRQGRAYLFDGVNDYGVGPSILGTGYDDTFDFNILITTGSDVTATQQVWIIGNNPQGSFGARILTGNMSVQVNAYASTIVAKQFAVAVNTSYAISGSWNGSTHTLTLVVNGVTISTVAGAFPATITGTYIGAVNSASFRFGGKLSLFNITSGAATIVNYNCNEEAGTVGYDSSGNGNHLTLTNITPSTFHATDTSVTANAANSLGFTLSGSTVIPRNEAIPTQDVTGGALQYTGQCPYPITVNTPCITGDGAAVYVNTGGPLMPATADFEVSAYYYHTTNSGTAMVVFEQRASGSTGVVVVGANMNASGTGASGKISMTVGASGPFTGVQAANNLVNNTWYFVKVTRVGNDWTFYVDGVNQGSVTNSFSVAQTQYTTLLAYTSGASHAAYSDGKIANFQITTGGVKTYFPLQDGAGTAATNRDLSYIKSNGTYGIVSSAIVGGTVATIWGTRTTGANQDWSINYGGRINASGVFIPATLDSSICADGGALTLTKGKHGNPYSRLNRNPYTAAEFNGRSIGTSIAPAAAITGTPSDSVFRRTATDGDDRFLIYEDTLTGADLTNVTTYIS